MGKSCPVKIEMDATAATPASNYLTICGESNLLNDKGSKVFHTIVEQRIFIGKFSRANIKPTISILSIRFYNPTVQDLEKLVS